MARLWMLNASPTILLAKIGQLQLVDQLCPQWIIPDGVAQEIQAGATNDPARLWLSRRPSARVQTVTAISPTVAAWDLGLGESQVLTWCQRNSGYEAILDDGQARKCAASLSIPVCGTLGVILLAKKYGYIVRMKPLFDDLLSAGFRVDKTLLAAALQWAGE